MDDFFPATVSDSRSELFFIRSEAHFQVNHLVYHSLKRLTENIS